MSEHEDGYGGNAGPTLEFESDFASQVRNMSASGDASWGPNAKHAHRSEEPLMTSGSGRPTQPMMGQRSIFGTGRGPGFAQIPTYTPVTRAPEPREHRPPEPPKSEFGIEARQAQADPHPRRKAPAGSDYSSPQDTPQARRTEVDPYPSRNAPAEPDYSSPDDAPQTFDAPQSYPSSNNEYGNEYGVSRESQTRSYSQSQAAESHEQPNLRPQPPQRQAYPAQEFPSPAQAQPNRSEQPSQAGRMQARADQAQPGQAHQPQFHAYQDAGFPEQVFSAEPPPDAGFADQGFPDASFPEANFADAGFGDASFSDASFPDGSFSGENYQDASFEDTSFQDASFPEEKPADADFSAAPSDGEEFDDPEPLHLESPASDFDTEPDYDPMATQAAAADGGYAPYEEAPQGHGYAVPSNQALQAFDAIYDQPPQIPLGATNYGNAQGFYEGEQGDADFLDEGQLEPGGEDASLRPGSKTGLRSRSMFMVGSALLGAVALGGALAFAYKQSGGGMSGGEPPLVQADSRPVKEPPQQPGGKQFPHKNKLIYDRLQNGAQPETERIVPRQEKLAVPAMPGAAPAPMPPPAVAPVDNSDAVDGGPRRVKTLVVRPDGSVMPPAAEPAPAAAPQQVADAKPAPRSQAAAAAPAADPQPVAAIPEAPKPKPAPAPKPEAAAPREYVVQVGSKQDQTDALATFADMQQKYPKLLSSYRPMVQKANLGAKGVWYRLRIGPLADKSAARKLCRDLKSQGHPDCLVMAQ